MMYVALFLRSGAFGLLFSSSCGISHQTLPRWSVARRLISTLPLESHFLFLPLERHFLLQALFVAARSLFQVIDIPLLQNDIRLQYYALDMAHLSRHLKSNVLNQLAGIAECSVWETGIFQSKPHLFKSTLDADPRCVFFHCVASARRKKNCDTVLLGVFLSC